MAGRLGAGSCSEASSCRGCFLPVPRGFMDGIVEEQIMMVKCHVRRERPMESVESIETDAQNERRSPKSWESQCRRRWMSGENFLLHKGASREPAMISGFNK